MGEEPNQESSKEPTDSSGSGSNSKEANFRDSVDEFATIIPALSESPEAETGQPPSKTERKIGPYKLLQKIGEGGMGTVWMAQQEKPVRRRVAIKLVKGELASQEIISRFEAERQALAMMDHQNIAKILDAGTTAQGSPYFVMELVKGVPITKYCDEQQLSVHTRLKLFASVCRAIQHAHQKGIIHRDLKPSNVLVTLYEGEPLPKVIDFGLAKAIDHRTKLSDNTIFTEFGRVVGTLQYMSPEQAGVDAMDIDTRSDIYSLGVILYELLTGSTPIEREEVGSNVLLKVLELIREKEPPRPSDRLSSSGEKVTKISERREIAPARLQQVLKGELDWVVMKALEKDRTRRYSTANDLAEDVERYLDDEAVLARPPSFAYQASKFVRKNRGFVAALSAIFLLLIAAAGISSWFAFEASRQRDLADQRTDRATRSETLANQRALQLEVSTKEAIAERERADQERIVALEVRKFLQNSLLRNASVWERANSRRDKSVAVNGNDVTISELLDIAAEEFSPEKIGAVFPGQPKVQAEILSTIADSYESIEELDRSLEFSKAASEILGSAFGKSSPEYVESKIILFFAGLRNFEYDMAVGSQVDAINISLDAYQRVEDLETSGEARDELVQEELEKAEQIFDAMIDKSLDRLDPSRFVLPVLDRDKTSGSLMVKTLTVVSQFKTLADKLEQRYGKDHSRSRYSRMGIVFCDYAFGAATGGQQLMENSVLEFERLLPWSKTWPDEKVPSRCLLEQSLAMMLEEQKMKPELALRLLEDSLVTLQEQLTEDHPALLFFELSLANAYYQRGRDREALDMFIALTPSHCLQLGGGLGLIRRVGRLARQTNRQGEVIDMLDETCRLARDVYGEERRTFDILMYRAFTKARFGKVDEAIEEIDQIIDEVVDKFGERNEQVFYYSAQSAQELIEAGQRLAAEKLLERFETARAESELGLGNEWIRATNRILAYNYLESGNFEKAEKKFLQSLEGNKLAKVQQYIIRRDQFGLSRTYFALKDFEKAIGVLEPLIKESTGGLMRARAPRLHEYQAFLAAAYAEIAEYEKAIKLISRMERYARSLVRKKDPEGANLLGSFLIQKADTHFRAQQIESAIAVAKEMLELLDGITKAEEEIVIVLVRLATFQLSLEEPPYAEVEQTLNSAVERLKGVAEGIDPGNARSLLAGCYQQRLRLYQAMGDQAKEKALREEVEKEDFQLQEWARPLDWSK